MTAASGLRMYSKAQAQDSQHQLIERYAPLVKRIAYHLLARLPANVQVDDLIQAGMIGLLEASKNTIPARAQALRHSPAFAPADPCLTKCVKATGHRVLFTAIAAWLVMLFV